AQERPCRVDDVVFTRPDGSNGILGITINPMMSEGKEQVGFLILGADITQRRKAEQALHSANKRLEELNDLKDDLIAKVSHELRTPLTSIKEGLSLLLDNVLGQTTAEQQDFLKTMDQDVNRLVEFVNVMLDISKIEAGRMRLQRQSVDPRLLIESLVASYQPLISRRKVCIDGDEAAAVLVDAERIRQVLTNLLSNALKHTQEEGSIYFHLKRADGMLGVAVEDNGPGIAPEDLPQLFQKFSQLGQPSTGGSRGTGLGLVLCRELVELHGGRIEVVSEVGCGSTFTVWLPLYSDDLALIENFKELRSMAPGDKGDQVGLVAIKAARLVEGLTPQECSQALGQLVDEVRRYVHRGDIVMSVAPHWVVVLALGDESGAKAIVKRLQAMLAESHRYGFGMACYPVDGTGATAIFSRAKERGEKNSNG
ncbi:MAG: PAS domain-containing sensor histidine kinase, partial [Candidatus Omnitrophica bacterium]|nr:PAS domain-containing sensor histidine kinase [Candidatus Omnitrophota bacterium]